MNSSFVRVHVVCESVFFTFLSFDFYLLSPYTTKQWMTYHWCYEYHSLRNAVLEYKLSDTTFLFYTFLTVNSRPQKQLCYVINFLQPYLFPFAQSTQKREHISMPWALFEPTIPVLEQCNTIFTLDSTTNVVGGIVPVGPQRKALSGHFTVPWQWSTMGLRDSVIPIKSKLCDLFWSRDM